MDNKPTNQQPGEQLRLAMRHWASGVGIAATEVEGVRYGLTVSSFTSVSVDPPVVMISVNKESYPHDLLLQAKKFGVTLLTADQQAISDRFAGRSGHDNDRFEGLETFTLKTGSPLILGGLAVFDCELTGTYETETTTVMFGEVVAARMSVSSKEELRPLLYYDQGYRHLAEEE